MSVRFVSGSVGFFVLVAAPMASAACYRDTECPGSQVCLDLECQEPATPLNKCGEDTAGGGSDGAGTDGGSMDDGGTTGGAVPPPQCAEGRVCVDDYCKEPDVHCGNAFGECYVGASWFSCACGEGGSDGGGTGGGTGGGDTGGGGSDALPAPTDAELYATCLAEVAFCEGASDGADGSTTDGLDVGSDATDASTGSGDDVGSDAMDGSTDSGGDVGSDGGSDASTDGASDGSTGATDGGGDDGGGDAADGATGGEADGGGTGDDASGDGGGDDGPSGDTAGDAADGAADGTTGTPSSSTASTGCTLGGAAASPACLLILGAFGVLRRRRSI